MMIRKTLAATACAALALPAFAQQIAPARTGFYNGNDEGKAPYRQSLDVTGQGQFAGYQFNRHLGVELGRQLLPHTYVPSDPAPILNGQMADKDVKIEQTSLSLMARYPVTEKVDLYGRAGYNHIEYKSDDGRRTKTTETVAGAGASYAISPKADMRVETQRVNARPAKVSVGAGFGF